MKREISALLLRQPTEPQHVPKEALEGRSVTVNWLRNYGEALPLFKGTDPPHLVFTDTTSTDPRNYLPAS
jgi:hypothetical protein